MTLCVNGLSNNIEIRNFQSDDMRMLGELYKAVSARENAIFWWVGDESNWANVFCAFENGKMIAKGQIKVINIVPSGRSTCSRHSIFINLKTMPERKHDMNLLDAVYGCLYSRALELKGTLPKGYGTMLCVGNDVSETANNDYFVQRQGFQHSHSLYTMTRDLGDPIAEASLPAGLESSKWKMETAEEETQYLEAEKEIQPHKPLGFERLHQYKQNPLWTAIVVREESGLVGSVMAWREEDSGCVEDVWVREPWRKRGIARYLLTRALDYLKSNGLETTWLMVDTQNASALSLYESVGFRTTKEETRFFTIIN